MHNDRMRLPLRVVGLGLAAVLALSGCSGDEPEGQQPVSNDSESPESSSPTATETPYLEVPEGVELSPQGGELKVGDVATVAYEPRQRTVGVLDIRVTAVERATFDLFEGWELNRETRATTPYFVRAKVANVGDTDLGEERVPLYIVDGENRLIEASTFTQPFAPCDGSVFPARFRNGDTHRACLVYHAPEKGRLTAVSFRPTQDFNPITWTGEVGRAGAEKNGDKAGDKAGGGDQGGQREVEGRNGRTRKERGGGDR